MEKEVDIRAYLPTFIGKINEIASSAAAENSEFAFVWKTIRNILQNEFIETADGYGLERFEKIMEICPKIQEDIEERRTEVASKWWNFPPYTIWWLNAALKKRHENYKTSISVDDYILHIGVEMIGIKELEKSLAWVKDIAPVNLVLDMYGSYTHCCKAPIKYKEAILVHVPSVIKFGHDAEGRAYMKLEVKPAAGGGTVDVERYLDGDRTLDGTWNLNAGTYQLS